MINMRYSLEELAARGDALYNQEVAPRVATEDRGRFVAIDVHSGAYEIDADDAAAVKRLLQRQPHAQFWLRRVGSRYAYRM